MEKKLALLKRKQLSSFQLIVFFYFSAILISTTLLSLPIAHKPEIKLSFIDALYTAVSAVSVTGLTVVSTADTFSMVGTLMLAFILQIGGIGIMTLGTFIWIILGKKIGLKERQLIMTDQNQSSLSGLVNLIRSILGLILIIEAIGTLVLGIHFLKYFSTWQEAFYNGFFAAVSATTNAGFDITGSSLVPFANDYFVQFIVIILMILGAIGFPVLIELKEFLTRKNDSYFRFSLFTKITTVTFFGMTIVGVVLIILLDYTNFFADKSWHEALFYALFQSVTTRSGGLSTMDMNEFTNGTLLVLSLMMFIGASPSSVGGGIRTTTFAIVLLGILFFAKGKTSVKVFKKEIYPDDVTRAFVVVCVAIIIWSISIILLSATESQPLLAIIFEVSSAFGTCGLSMGITPELSTFGKILSMMLMFIGRVGILTFLFLIRGKVIKENFHYPKERVIIG
ncbi:Ktr system potassium uptake protein D [Lottiidibacillus patelloidae]|uniref:Ktr system potassium uptake protein D n=1 Tax=Lottiidibacillus patelloidae TaxID=2670334 RepID=A0A263BWN8_9BACI|nr:TrkH family potassium uptake protein [Lottiidibacillus patelloidae]OZM58124.1 Ktr system potassium uptake protein D [Lottiidibacillus patelloidae]